MEPQAAETYLRDRLPATRDLEVVSLRRSYPGMSRETWLVDARWRQEGRDIAGGFVFRMDTPGGSICPTPLRREYEVYRRLAGTPVPVPRVLCYETDSGWLTDGREFYVREKIEGQSEIPGLFDPSPQYDDLRQEVAREHLSKLAALHTLDWRALGFGEVMEVPPDEASCARFDLELWEETFDRVRVEPFPLIRQIICWLKDNPPAPAPRLALLKGNNGLSEEVWQGTRIVAMCDWELAHVGDPVEDWLSIELNPRVGQRGISDLFDHRQLREMYEDMSGLRLNPESVRYYEVLRAVKSLVTTASAAGMVAGGKDLRASTASMGLAVHRSQATIARTLGLIP